jgi:hypothetical protein
MEEFEVEQNPATEHMVPGQQSSLLVQAPVLVQHTPGLHAPPPAGHSPGMQSALPPGQTVVKLQVLPGQQSALLPHAPPLSLQQMYRSYGAPSTYSGRPTFVHEICVPSAVSQHWFELGRHVSVELPGMQHAVSGSLATSQVAMGPHPWQEDTANEFPSIGQSGEH